MSAANVNDGKRLDEVLSAIVVKRKCPPLRRSKHLCADAAYRSAECLRIIEQHGYIPHVVDRRTKVQAKRQDSKKKARRWVVEVCHSWFNRFRRLLVRWEKKAANYLGFLHLAALLIVYRKLRRARASLVDDSLCLLG